MTLLMPLPGALRRNQLPKIALFTTVALALCGCFGGEPSAGNMLDAVKKESSVREAIKMTAAFDGSKNPDQAADEMVKTIKVEKSGCAQAQGKPGYMCDFRIGMQAGGKFEYGPPANGRFFKAGDEWRLEMP